jgi:hypothetical protein
MRSMSLQASPPPRASEPARTTASTRWSAASCSTACPSQSARARTCRSRTLITAGSYVSRQERPLDIRRTGCLRIRSSHATSGRSRRRGVRLTAGPAKADNSVVAAIVRPEKGGQPWCTTSCPSRRRARRGRGLSKSRSQPQMIKQSPSLGLDSSLVHATGQPSEFDDE